MNQKMSGWSRLVMVICAAAMVLVLFVPMWRIDLVAPQYPEGLYLLIHADKLSGNVDIINGLNHYIGMKTLHTDDFPEFTILPYIIGFFALLFLVTAILGRRLLLNISLVLFVLFGIVAMIDFWKWEYDYGHNLNPDAAIKVPGMSYQPPLIGYKQLLNFSAYSMPDIGGWIFVGIGVVLVVLVFLSWKNAKKLKIRNTVIATSCLMMFSLTSCNTEPTPLKIGVDHCDFCKMTISDNKFGAELITKKGKIFKFDDSHCVVSYLSLLEKSGSAEDVGAIYFTNYSGDHELINSNKAVFLQSDALKSPMGGNIAAFASKSELDAVKNRIGGTELNWEQVKPK